MRHDHRRADTRPLTTRAPRTRLFALARRTLRHVRHVLPSACALCGAAMRGGRLCPGCRHDALGLGSRRHAATLRCPWCAARLAAGAQGCADCLLRVPAFDHAIVAADYAPPLDVLIRQAKQGYRPGVLLALGELLADAVSRHASGLPAGTVLVPIPGAQARLNTRGFNPAREIARVLGDCLDLPVAPTLLRLRQDDGLAQRLLSRAERLSRGRDRFVVDAALHGQAMALVDDVMTTGSTLDAAASALRAAGADPVIALAVARTPAPRARRLHDALSFIIRPCDTRQPTG